MQAGLPIVAENDLNLELSAATAFTSGLLLRFARYVTHGWRELPRRGAPVSAPRD